MWINQATTRLNPGCPKNSRFLTRPGSESVHILDQSIAPATSIPDRTVQTRSSHFGIGISVTSPV